MPREVLHAKTPEEHAKALMEAFIAKAYSFPVPTGLQHYEPRPTDTIISTYMKAGTTLLQNLAYHLAYLTTIAPDSGTPPLETFTDVCVISPYIDYIPECDGMDYPTNDPRIMKSHAPFRDFARLHDDPLTAPRHIVVIRSPFDFAPSYLDFLFEDMVGRGPETQTRAVREAFFHDFVRQHVTSASTPCLIDTWFEHTRGWTAPLRANVLVLFYEDVVREVKGAVRAVASFMQVEKTRVTDEVVDKVAVACDRDAMAADVRFRLGVEARLFGVGKRAKAVPERRANSFKEFAYCEEEVAGVRGRMESVLGYASYEEFKEATKKAQAEMFGR